MDQNVRKKSLLVFLFFFITYAYFFQGGGWNQNCRVSLIRAMFHEQTFAIDSFLEPSSAPDIAFDNTGDWSHYNGHYYINKSPGLSMLGLVPYAVAHYAACHIFPSDTERQVHFSTYVSTVCTVGVCGALLCAALFYLLVVFLKMTRSKALMLTMFFGLGTFVFSYATTLYSHVPAAFFSFFSFLLAMHIRQGESRYQKIMALFSGFSASLAVFIEPSAVLMLGLILLYFLGFSSGRKCVMVFLFGCIPCGFLQCFYNAVCFGGPFQSSYAYANEAVMVKINGNLFGVPRIKTMVEMLFLPYRGLFVTSPVMLMIFPGTALLLREKKLRLEALFFVVVSVGFFIYMAGFHAWHGGSTVGPRYLLPAFPFIFMLSVCAIKFCPKIFVVFGTFSILINLCITAIGNEIPVTVKNPCVDVIFKEILRGNVSINPTPITNFAHYPSIYDLAIIKLWTPNFNSFNLGEIFFPHSLLSLVPLFVVWLVSAYIWKRFSA